MEDFNLWLARDLSGELFLFDEKPHKNASTREWVVEEIAVHCLTRVEDEPRFSKIKWENEEPTPVKITLMEN